MNNLVRFSFLAVMAFTGVQSQALNSQEFAALIEQVFGVVIPIPEGLSFDSAKSGNLFSNIAPPIPSTLATVYTTAESAADALASTEPVVGASASTEPAADASASTEPVSETTGRGTYYDVGNDNCGTVSTNSEYVVAIAQSLYETEAGTDDISGYCGKYINASYDNKSVRVRVVDSCESCTDNDLDFSPAAFEQLANKDVGVIQVTWAFEE